MKKLTHKLENARRDMVRRRFPASRVATAALLFTGLATRAAASWAQRVIRGEVDPSRVMDRSVSAAATESDKKSGNTGLKEP